MKGLVNLCSERRACDGSVTADVITLTATRLGRKIMWSGCHASEGELPDEVDDRSDETRAGVRAPARVGVRPRNERKRWQPPLLPRVMVVDSSREACGMSFRDAMSAVGIQVLHRPPTSPWHR